MRMINIALQLEKYAKKEYAAIQNKDWNSGYSQAIKDLLNLGQDYSTVGHGEPDKCEKHGVPLAIRNRNKQSGVESFCPVCEPPNE